MYRRPRRPLITAEWEGIAGRCREALAIIRGLGTAGLGFPGGMGRACVYSLCLSCSGLPDARTAVERAILGLLAEVMADSPHRFN